MLNYIFISSIKAVEALTELSAFHENFQTCIYHILMVKDEVEYSNFQNQLFLDVVKLYDEFTESVTGIIRRVDLTFLLEKALCERNFYMRYLFNNKINHETLVKALNTRLTRNNKIVELSEPNDIELLNQDSLTLLKKLSENLLIDVNYVKEALKAQAHKEKKHEQLDEIIFEKYPSPKERELVLRPEDLENEEGDFDQIKPDIEKGHYLVHLEAYKYIGLLKASLSVMRNFAEVPFINRKAFGLSNLKKIEFIGLIFELFLNINYLVKRREDSEESPEIIKILSSVIAPEFEEEFKSFEFDLEVTTQFFKTLVCCLGKYEMHSIMHLQVESIILSVCSEYCPVRVGESLVSSNFIESLLDISKSNETLCQLSILCEVATNIFISSNSEIQSHVESGN